MAQYIDKDALVSEIERRITQFHSEKSKEDASVSDKLSLGGRIAALEEFNVFINTLEVKEVNLEKEIDSVWNPHFNLGWDDNSLVSINHKSFESIAKHFIELGIKLKQTSEEIKIGETQIYLNDDGGETPYDGKQWLDISCTEYEIPEDKFKDGDDVELIIRKKLKGE